VARDATRLEPQVYLTRRNGDENSGSSRRNTTTTTPGHLNGNTAAAVARDATRLEPSGIIPTNGDFRSRREGHGQGIYGIYVIYAMTTENDQPRGVEVDNNN